MTIAEQKLQLTQNVLAIKDKKLLFQLEHLIDVHNKEIDLWDELPLSVQQDIDEAKKEAIEGKGKSHKSIMKKNKQWF
jgi:hypothetical protein